MPTPIAMPKLGMTMREGRVLAWPLPVGSRVEKGQSILLIESEKTEIEVEAPAAGVLRYVYVQPDATVPCGTLLAAITDSADEPFDAAAFRQIHDRPEKVVAAVATAASKPATTAGRTGSGVVTPAARALARQLEIDASAVPGTGPSGRVTKEDVEAWAARRPARVEVAPGVALEVPTLGAGDTVVLLPGFGTDVSVFAPQTRVLVERFCVKGINPRGVGLSDAPDAVRYDVSETAADVATLLDQQAHVVGASLGAGVAIELALTHADRVRSLTLITPFIEASPRLLAVIDAWCALRREASPETLARSLLPWLFSTGFLAEPAARERTVRGLAATVARVSAATLERSAAGLRAWSGTRSEALARVHIPTLVVAAGDDLLTPDGEALARFIPNATSIVVPTSGHAVTLEAAGTVGTAILRHLTQ